MNYYIVVPILGTLVMLVMFVMRIYDKKVGYKNKNMFAKKLTKKQLEELIIHYIKHGCTPYPHLAETICLDTNLNKVGLFLFEINHLVTRGIQRRVEFYFEVKEKEIEKIKVVRDILDLFYKKMKSEGLIITEGQFEELKNEHGNMVRKMITG